MAESEVMVTVEVVVAQPPNPEVIVQVSTVVSPTVSPATAELGSLTDEADPVPENVDHVPVSAPETALAARVPEVTLHKF
jgi:hypothetical protein